MIMRLYKFLPEAFAISNISLKRLKISELNKLNDPFEFLGFDLLNPVTLAAINGTKKTLSDTKGLVSFSETYSEPLLWGHYADGHRGMALGFDIDDSVLIKVQYRAQRYQIDLDPNTGIPRDGERTVQEMISRKYKGWEYEKEWRFFIELDESKKEGGFYFCDIDDKICLKEVWIGLECPLSRYRVENLLVGYNEKIRVRKAGLHRREFKITEDRSFRSVRISP